MQLSVARPSSLNEANHLPRFGRWSDGTKANGYIARLGTEISFCSAECGSRRCRYFPSNLLLRSDHFDNLMTTIGIDLFHDSMDMILHREFRQVEIGGDLLVGHAFGDQVHQLHLAMRQ